MAQKNTVKSCSSMKIQLEIRSSITTSNSTQLNSGPDINTDCEPLVNNNVVYNSFIILLNRYFAIENPLVLEKFQKKL